MGEPITLERGGFHWQVAPTLAERGDLSWLLDANGLRLAEWEAAGGVQVLKRAPHRMLYRVTLPQLDFHLKFYPMNDARALLRQLVRPSKARMEYDRAREVASRGVPTIEPVALGEVPNRPGASYLLTRTLPGTRSLAWFLENEMPLLERRLATLIRQRLARELGQLIARMHDGGILHHDLHPGNVLLTLDAENEPSLYLIDLLDSRLRSPLDWTTCQTNLAMLNRWFLLRSGRTDRLRFWRAYETARTQPLPPASPGSRERTLERASLASCLQFWRSLDRRCLGSNRYFRRVRGPNARGHASTQLPADLVEQILRDPDALFDTEGARRLKDSRSARVAVVSAAGQPLLWKRFAVTTWSDPWTALFRPTAALRSWVLGHALRLRGLPTPQPLLMLHRTWLTLPREGYLLTEFIPEARDLLAHADHLRCVPEVEREERLRAVTLQLANVVARLHRYRLSHRDLKATNILVSPKPWVMPRTDKSQTGEPPSGRVGSDHVWLIDLVGLRQQRRLGQRRKIQNLARLHASFRAHPLVSTTTKLRFLKAYLGERGQDAMVWKAYWRGIAEATAAKVARNLRSGRPLH